MASTKGPSRLHQTVVEMLRGKPALAVELLRAAGSPVPERATATSLGEALAPIEDYRPDTLFAVHRQAPATSRKSETPGRRGARQVLDRVLVVEVQLERRRRKRFSLPVYQALARARHRTACEVLVFTPAEEVASWIARPIRLGGDSVFRAVVVGPGELRRIRGRRRRSSLRAQVAFLRAVAHGEHQPTLVLRAARTFDALLPDDRAALYFDVILETLPVTARRELESLMQKEPVEFRSEFMRNLVKEGLDKGRTEGRAEGLAEGRSEGLAEGLRAAIRAVLSAREVTLSKVHERRLDACDEVAALQRWARRAARAETAADVFDAPEPAKRARRPRRSRA